jgi:hypothetical protein
MRSVWFLWIALGSLAKAFPSPPDDGLQFNTPDARKKNLPMVELPYSSYQAVQYIAKGDVSFDIFTRLTRSTDANV